MQTQRRWDGWVVRQRCKNTYPRKQNKCYVKSNRLQTTLVYSGRVMGSLFKFGPLRDELSDLSPRLAFRE